MSQLPEGFRSALEAAFRDSGRPIPSLISLDAVPGGSINQTFQLRASTGVYFCKWNPAAPPGFFRREAEGLAALASAAATTATNASAPLRIPQVIAVAPEPRESDSGQASPAPGQPAFPRRPALLVLEYLEPDPDGPSRQTWEELGRGLAAMHRAPEERFGFDRDNFCGLTPQENAWSADWAAFFRDRRLGALIRRLEQRGDLGTAERDDYARLLDRLPDLLRHAPRPSLIHGDLWSGNFLAAAAGPALVDPAAYCADREAEWAMMLLFGGFPETVLAAYQEAWPLPEGWRERVPIYQLYHVLNHFLLFGGGYGGQAIRIARNFV